MMKLFAFILFLISTSSSYAGPSCYMIDLSGTIRLTTPSRQFSLVLVKNPGFKNGYFIDTPGFRFNRVVVMSNGGGCEMTWYNDETSPQANDFAVTPISNITHDGRIHIGTEARTDSFLGIIEVKRAD